MKFYFDKALIVQDIVTKEFIVALTEINKVFETKTNGTEGKYYN